MAIVERIITFALAVVGGLTGLALLRDAMATSDPLGIWVGFFVTYIAGMFAQQLKDDVI